MDPDPDPDPDPERPPEPGEVPDWSGGVDNHGFLDLECAVCFSQFNNVFNTPKKLQCGHTFCLECLARMNVKSSQPESLQCPLCRAYTALPTLGLPKLATDATVLSCLPDAMQHVYSIRFNRNRGRLQVKRVPSSAPSYPSNQQRSLDVGTPVDTEADQGGLCGSGFCSFLSRLTRVPLCRAVLMISGALVMVTLTTAIVIFLSHRN